jgi:hypothetical protein
MTNREQQLLRILSIGHDTSIRGAGLSLREALSLANYRQLRTSIGPADLLPLIKANPRLVREWLAYSEDKRTSGGWYILENGEVVRVGEPNTHLRFESIDEAAAEYVVRELGYWSDVGEARRQRGNADKQRFR